MSEKVDDFLTDIFDGRKALNSELEEKLYILYWGKMMGTAMRYVVDRELAREIVNDSFMKAFDKLSTFKGNGEDKPIILQAWLNRITINTAIDALRKKSKAPALTYIDRIEDHPAIEIEDHLQVEDIMRLLKKIPDLYRIVFNLYELEGYSHEEIGKMMSIPTSSSRVYLSKAKQELRKLYINYFGGLQDG